MSNGEPWTDAETEQLLQMRSEGKSYAQISKEIGRTTGSISQRLNLLRRREQQKQVDEYTPAFRQPQFPYCPMCGHVRCASPFSHGPLVRAQKQHEPKEGI